VTETIPIYIGTSAGGEDAESQSVAEFTLRKYASQPIDITWLTLSKDPSSFWYGWNTKNWGTPFSGLRWGIPAFRNFEGKVIYLDGDIICRADIVELWNQTIPKGAIALVNGAGKELRTCIMLLDCARARKHLPPIEVLRSTYKQYEVMISVLRKRPYMSAVFNSMWNCVDLKMSTGINDPRVKLIHYSSQWEQPHLPHAQARLAAQGRKHWFDGPTTSHREPQLTALFDELLIEAINAGYSPEKYEPEKPFGPYHIRSYANRYIT